MNNFYKKIIPSMLVVIALLYPLQVVYADASCRTFGKVTKKVVNSTAAELTEWVGCLSAAPETGGTSMAVCGALEAAKAVSHYWNKILAQNNWATLGPRELTFQPEKGRVIGGTGRLFYTSQLMPKGTKVKFTKTARKGHADVAVCVAEVKKIRKKTWKMVTWDIAKGKHNIGKTWEWTYNGEHGDYVFIGVHISGKSVGKEVKYEIQMLNK